jgi:hypothetical protein
VVEIRYFQCHCRVKLNRVGIFNIEELEIFMKQDLEHKNFQLPAARCLSHTWQQPVFDFLASNHFNGTHFLNALRPPEAHKRSNFIKWMLKRRSSTWKVDRKREYATFEQASRSLPQNRPNARLDDWQVWFVGHATVLIQIGPYNLLTDPVWAEYAGPKQGSGPRRVCPAGIALEELPEIHAVLLSHNHYDHMDIASLEWLHERFAMPIYTGLGNTKNLASTTVNKVDASATQAAQTANAKIQDSKETFGGKPQHPAPIEHQSLSEPSNNNTHNSSTSSNSPLSTPSQNQSATTSSSSTTSYAVTDL